MLRFTLAIALGISLSSGCRQVGSQPPERVGVQPAPTEPSAPAAAEATLELPKGVPDSPAGHQLAWVLDTIVARHGKVDAAEIEKHFHASFIAQVPVDQMVAILGQLGTQLADLSLGEVVADPSGVLVARVEAKAGKLRVILGVDATTKTINALLFQPDIEVGPKPASLDEAEKTVTTLAPRAQMLIASLERGKCKPLRKVASTDQLAIGSTFKLYVLLGLVDQILAGKTTWDAELKVRDDWKSLPSGTTQEDPEGTALTVRTLAERMISISDNTATDHILYTVGRQKVEAALRATKHAKPALDVPFLSTRELFLLKLDLSAEEVARYLESTAKERRAFLDGTLVGRKPKIEGASDWTEPRHIGELEWFASADDLCRVMATLAARAKKPAAAAVLEVLSKNPGLPIDKAAWPYVGFKGGSEPGVMNLTWLLRRDDDAWFVVTLGFNAPEGPALDEGKILGLATGVLELLAKENR